MRVLLIPASLDFFPMYAAPLGEAYIAAYIQKQGHEVEILDLALHEDIEKDISNAIDRFDPEVIGMSIRNIDIACYPATMFFYPPAKDAVLYVKQITDVPIILGGSGFSIFAEEILRDIPHDIGVFGEGELVFAEILKRIERGEDPRSLPKGVCYIDNNGNYIQNPPWRVENLDELPLPARELLNNDEYKLVDGRAIGNIQTHRGCPFKCIFCSYKYLEGHTMRYRSPEMIAEELEVMVNNFGIPNVFITDSVLNLNYTHLKDTCELIKDRRIDVKWGCNYRADNNFLKILPLMKESGADHFAIGVDSLSESVLAKMQKGNKKADIIQTTKKCTELEIEQFLSVMLGAPGETLNTVRETLDTLNNLDVHMGTWQGMSEVLLMTGIRIYPHTELQKIAEAEGVIPKGQNLLLPKFYITPAIREQELFDFVKSYCDGKATWNYPGLGINCPQEMTDFMKKQLVKYGIGEA